MPSIFINYRREDSKAYAVLLKEKIQASFENVRVFLDTEDIEAGQHWPNRLEQELREATVVLSLIGKSWLKCQDEYGIRRLDIEEDWVRKEIELALELISDDNLIIVLLDKATLPSKEAFSRIPKLKKLLEREYQEIPFSRSFSDEFEPLKNRLAKLLEQRPLNPLEAARRENILRDYPLSKEVRNSMPQRSLSPDGSSKWKHCPFVGLNYFTRDTARLYFGRDMDLLELILKVQNRDTRLIFLHGYSGVGKSSLLSAGLVPRLEEQRLVLYHRRDKAVGLAGGLRQLRKKAAKVTRPVLYILDQVEEMFTDLSIADEQTSFAQGLAEAVRKEPGATFLLGFRSEYLPKVDELCWDVPGVAKQEILPLSREGVFQAITGVWKDEELNAKYQLDIEEGLPEAIAAHLSLHQIRDYVAPILQNRLERLWEKAFKGSGQEVKLTKALYDELGDATEKELLNSRLARMQQQAEWDEEKTLEVLNRFVIDLPSAGAIKKKEMEEKLAGINDYAEVLEELQKVDLLIKEAEGRNNTVRLSHDLLAKSVRERYDEFRNRQTLQLKLENFNLHLKQAQESLAGLAYEEAAAAVGKALKTGVQKEKLVKEAMELAYFYNEAGQPSKALEWLQRGKEEEVLKGASLARLEELAPGKEGFRQQCRSILQELNGGFFAELEEWYYPEMIKVEGGALEMGSNEYNNEKPPHQVTVSSFLMATTPTTFRQYGLFCAATGRSLPGDSGWGKGSRPAINVNWYDAAEFCNWLSEANGLAKVYTIHKDQKDPNNQSNADEFKWLVIADHTANGYRLPTEAEWEFAARGRGQRPAGQYAGSDNLDEVGWYDKNSDSKTQPVKKKKKNELGLYDMSGNVWEWCWDWYGSYQKEAQVDPIGTDSGSYRVLRGGSWDSGPDYARCARRYNNRPDHRYNYYGFRLARTGGQ